MRNQSESQLQKAVAKLLDHTGLDWLHVPNGGSRNIVEAAKLKAHGVKKGAPDILVFNYFPMPGDDSSDRELNEIRGNYNSGLAIELKAGKNKPTEAQLDWHEKLRRNGWRVEVCRSLDEVLKVLRECYPTKIAA